jgi:HTH-type transcriptional regulator / antitoxin HipB
MDYPLKLADQLRPQLRALRKQRGMTQARLGQAIGVTQARIVEIEANPGVVNLQQVMQVLQALGAALVIRTTAGEPDESDRPAAKPAAKTRHGSW